MNTTNTTKAARVTDLEKRIEQLSLRKECLLAQGDTVELKPAAAATRIQRVLQRWRLRHCGRPGAGLRHAAARLQVVNAKLARVHLPAEKRMLLEKRRAFLEKHLGGAAGRLGDGPLCAARLVVLEGRLAAVASRLASKRLAPEAWHHARAQHLKIANRIEHLKSHHGKGLYVKGGKGPGGRGSMGSAFDGPMWGCGMERDHFKLPEDSSDGEDELHGHHHGKGHFGKGHFGKGHLGKGHFGKGNHGKGLFGKGGEGHHGKGHFGKGGEGHHGKGFFGEGHHGMGHPGKGHHGKGHHGKGHHGKGHHGKGHHGKGFEFDGKMRGFGMERDHFKFSEDPSDVEDDFHRYPLGKGHLGSDYDGLVDKSPWAPHNGELHDWKTHGDGDY